MATFRCKATGNTVTFTLPHDIESMEGHDAYEEVFEDEEETEVEQEVIETPVKRKGRPPKGAK